MRMNKQVAFASGSIAVVVTESGSVHKQYKARLYRILVERTSK